MLEEGQVHRSRQSQARLPGRPLRPSTPRPKPATRRPPGRGGAGPGVRAASPAGELECEEQRAAERHGPAEQFGPPARHEGGAAQPAAEPALRGSSRGRAEGAGARAAAATATLVLGVVAAAAAAAAASAFRHYMLPVAGFIPPPPRARRPGPARRSPIPQLAEPANPDGPRQPRRSRGARPRAGGSAPTREAAWTPPISPAPREPRPLAYGVCADPFPAGCGAAAAKSHRPRPRP